MQGELLTKVAISTTDYHKGDSIFVLPEEVKYFPRSYFWDNDTFSLNNAFNNI